MHTAPPTLRIHQARIARQLHELRRVDVLHAAADLAPLPHPQPAVRLEHLAQVRVRRSVDGDGGRFLARLDASVAGALAVVACQAVVVLDELVERDPAVAIGVCFLDGTGQELACRCRWKMLVMYCSHHVIVSSVIVSTSCHISAWR